MLQSSVPCHIFSLSLLKKTKTLLLLVTGSFFILAEQLTFDIYAATKKRLLALTVKHHWNKIRRGAKQRKMDSWGAGHRLGAYRGLPIPALTGTFWLLLFWLLIKSNSLGGRNKRVAAGAKMKASDSWQALSSHSPPITNELFIYNVNLAETASRRGKRNKFWQMYPSWQMMQCVVV